MGEGMASDVGKTILFGYESDSSVKNITLVE